VLWCQEITCNGWLNIGSNHTARWQPLSIHWISTSSTLVPSPHTEAIQYHINKILHNYTLLHTSLQLTIYCVTAVHSTLLLSLGLYTNWWTQNIYIIIKLIIWVYCLSVKVLKSEQNVHYIFTHINKSGINFINTQLIFENNIKQTHNTIL